MSDCYTGFDTGTFPGADRLAWLKANTRLSWCGFYLGPAPSHHDAGWMGQRKTLLAQGWGLAPIYLGQQTAGPGSRNVSAQQGGCDGEEAVRLADVAGFPRQSTIYLDWEDGSRPSDTALAYISRWVAAVIENGYQPGLYCSHVLAPLMAASVTRSNPAAKLRIWVWKVSTDQAHAYQGDIKTLASASPAGSGYPATLWQFEQNCVLPLPGACQGLQVDLSWSALQDPSFS